MPKGCVTATPAEPNFANFKSRGKVISATQQKKIYDEFLKAPLDYQHSAIWCSAGNDEDPLRACTQVLLQQAKASQTNFRFFSPFDEIPRGEDVPHLCILLGVHEQDVECMNRVRRWLRTPHGSAVWVVATVKDPFLWVSEQLGVVPNYLFWCRKPSVHVG